MTGALAGLVVVDLSQYIAGPYATMLMADAGATVIKVEPPRGDATRMLEPQVPRADGDGTVSAFYLRMNRGKRSVALDLKTDDGRDALAGLLARADVLVENYRAGVLDGLGFGAEELRALNPRLVYCSVSGFGHTPSPQRDRPSYNTVAEYETGVWHPGGPGGLPGPVGPPVGDMVPALHALAGLLMALYRRSVTGEGAHVDIAMHDSMLSLNELRSSTAVFTGSDRHPDGREYFCPYGVFAVRDGHISLDVTTDRQWRGFCAAIGHPGLADRDGMDTGPRRAAQYDEHIRGPLEHWLAERTRDEAAARFIAHGVPVAVLRTSREALLSAQAAARGMRLSVGEGPAVGGCEAPGDGVTVTVPGSPVRIGALRAPAADAPTAPTGCGTAPPLGADARTVLTRYAGLDPDAVDRLCAAGAAEGAQQCR
ncbi:CaiB/BaiF CoA transferase family protein [Tomitella gaofuii]|uniref:CaiB/BaiF CoA transferase family protein n=1 Tax=Tomitella gaofuii TaxID=2760083 RepID=UPI0015F9AB0B|nr:CoA transferase [Tomitella gaofuii]